ncbi:MAG: hypothetical protein PVF46_04955, partial [Lysobacterales bacterium]|jgi:pectate lyase
VEVVFKPYADGLPEQRFFHMQEDASESRVMFETRLVEDGQWLVDTFIKSGDQGVPLYAVDDKHEIGPWYHAAIVVDGNSFSHYVNGNLELGEDIQYAAQGPGRTSLGVRLNEVHWFKGAISTARFTSSALAPEEFLAISSAAGETTGVDAFPGAEGFGRHAVGGRGGRVVKVTNLDDDGSGSLRQALRERGPRTVVFDVSGTIELERAIVLKEGHVTIAGQTAPGAGITLKNHGLVIKADQVIVRYIRSRPGSQMGVETDAISVGAGTSIIIDHCSTSWATDETLTVSPSEKSGLRTIDKVTVQWSMITESLNDSVHSKGAHGYGSLVRGNSGARYSFHHNLWAHHKARMPRPGNYLDIETDPQGPLFDFRNNVFYNWGGASSGYNADTDSISRYNFVNNYYIRGVDSKKSLAFDEGDNPAQSYFAGNAMNGRVPDNPWDLVRFEGRRRTGHDTPFPVAPVRTQTANEAFEDVLRSAGASLVRDTVDQRIIGHVKNGTGGIIDDVSEVGGWPRLESASPRPDQDGDGMPDEWELTRGLDPQNPADGATDANGDGYTNLEDYINGLISP